MAWNPPPNLANGATLQESWVDAVYDSFKWLGEADGRGTSLPGSPVDGQRYWYVADATKGVVWALVYRSGSASSYKWEKVGGPALEVGFDTLTETPGTSYGDFSTPLSLTTPLGGDYRIEGRVRNTDVGSTVNTQLDVYVDAAVIGRNYTYQSGGSGPEAQTGIILRPITRSIAVAKTVKLQRANSLGSISTTFWDCSLRIDPVRVG